MFYDKSIHFYKKNDIFQMPIRQTNAVLSIMREKSPSLKLLPTWKQEWIALRLESCEFCHCQF